MRSCRLLLGAHTHLQMVLIVTQVTPRGLCARADTTHAGAEPPATQPPAACGCTVCSRQPGASQGVWTPLVSKDLERVVGLTGREAGREQGQSQLHVHCVMHALSAASNRGLQCMSSCLVVRKAAGCGGSSGWGAVGMVPCSLLRPLAGWHCEWRGGMAAGCPRRPLPAEVHLSHTPDLARKLQCCLVIGVGPSLSTPMVCLTTHD